MSRNGITFADVENRLVKQHREKRDEWYRHTLTLTATALTLLVGLQKAYVPEQATALALLRLCWGSLAVGIVAGVFGLWGQSQIPIDAINNLRRMRSEEGDEATAARLNEGMHYRIRPVFRVAEVVFFGCLLVGVVSLTWFACANLG